ncbi:MAG: dihydrolipoyl dehydrogenase [Firmicutes bacterium]|nr:dihydrolipoyl dehydrogenase [Bacillota bacterium]
MKDFDLIVIGAGPGGYVAAIKAAKLGMKTAIVENIKVGGTCLNRGCIPAKAMIHAAGLYKEISHEGEIIGVYADNVRFDYGKIVEYKQDTSDELVKGVEALLEGNGVTRIDGTGKILPDKNVCVKDAEGNETVYSAENVLLATGSVPSTIPVPGIDLPGVLTSDGVFQLTEMPESLVIIGGGVIGVEFATVFADLGAKVTIVEALPRILQNMDKEISQNLKMILKKADVDIHTGAMVKRIEETEDGLTVFYEEKDKELSATGQYVICAAGRKPYTEGLFGEGVDIAMDGPHIDTDETKAFETNVKGVYAIGDIVPGIKLAHMASAQGIYCVEKMAARRNGDDCQPDINLKAIPACVYTDPEIAQVGMTEADAKEQGIDVKVGKFIMSANGKSLITHEERGFIKVVAKADTDEILGAQMMCARATDMISEFVTAIANEKTVQQLLKAVRPHPTYNEGITEALEDTIGESLHTIPRRRR